MPYVMSTGGILIDPTQAQKRGINVFSLAETQQVSGVTKRGEVVSGGVQMPLFSLTYEERQLIYQRCDAVFGVITGRARKIAALEWRVLKQSKEEDRIEYYLKSWQQVHGEYEGDDSIKGATVRRSCVQMARKYLRDLKNDMSNFQGSLMRWRRRIQDQRADDAEHIQEWLSEPNIEDDWSAFVMKLVSDMLIHGAAAIYKEWLHGYVENFYVLPGGSVYPMRSKFVGGGRSFVQVMAGVDTQVFFTDEIAYIPYMPSSTVSYGMVPLEALVNKVAETLLFDQWSAERADGTRAPEKLVVFGDNAPFGPLTGDSQLSLPLPKDEQSRIETIINEPRKNAIRMLTGYGTPAVVDLSRADTYSSQMQRQKDIREAVALVYNMSNMEVNLSGGDDTSGRSTSESQERIEKGKGIAPIVLAIEEKINREILPLRFGSDYMFEFRSGMTEGEQATIDDRKMRTGTYSVNEIRIARGDEPYSAHEYDLPRPQQPEQQQGPPGQDEQGGGLAAMLGGMGQDEQGGLM